MKREKFDARIKKILDKVDSLLQEAADISETHVMEFEWVPDLDGTIVTYYPHSQWHRSACEWEESADDDVYGWHTK